MKSTLLLIKMGRISHHDTPASLSEQLVRVDNMKIALTYGIRCGWGNRDETRGTGEQFHTTVGCRHGNDDSLIMYNGKRTVEEDSKEGFVEAGNIGSGKCYCS